MKKFFFFLTLFFAVSHSFAQVENPVKWSFTAKKNSDKTTDVFLTATLSPGWHIYAIDAGEGPMPTTVKFTPNPLLKLEGNVRQDGKLQKEYDKNFDTELKFFSNKVSFVQKFKLKTAASTTVRGTITYMVCNDVKCLPPKTIPFTIKLP